MNQICINVVYVLCSILLFSCDTNNNVTSYRIKSPQPTPAVIENIPEQLNWTKPKNWIQKPATNMRLASFEISDLNNDNINDLLIIGNDYGNEPFIGPYDALCGLVLLGIDKNIYP